jgi:hypothetical protein
LDNNGLAAGVPIPHHAERILIDDCQDRALYIPGFAKLITVEIYHLSQFHGSLVIDRVVAKVREILYFGRHGEFSIEFPRPASRRRWAIANTGTTASASKQAASQRGKDEDNQGQEQAVMLHFSPPK